MVAPNSHYCQICFDEIPSKDAAVTSFCGPTCPAVLCKPCLVHHVSVALQVGYVGALPRVRCPICLVRVHKSQWNEYITMSTLTTDGKWVLWERYKSLCEQASTFRTPCCHNSSYAHMPEFIDAAGVKPPQPVTMLKSQIAPLRKMCRQFGRHKINARDLITYIADTFPQQDKCDIVLQNVLVRLMDEERRATLLLSYHALHRVVVTRCCGWRTCFNCKRASPSETEGCACEKEEDEIDEEIALVQCRSCRAMLVKVDGCDSVYCLCGFCMDWSDELQYRDEHKKRLLPVDPFDTTVFGYWITWHRCLVSLFDELQNSAHVKMKLKSLAKSCPSFVQVLRRFIWWRRFKQLHRSELLAQFVRAKYMDRVLVPLVKPVLVKRIVQHRMKDQVLKELTESMRSRFVTREIAKQRPVLAAFVSRVMEKCRRRRVVQELKGKSFWRLYAETHEAEQRQLKSEESAFLSQFNVCGGGEEEAHGESPEQHSG